MQEMTVAHLMTTIAEIESDGDWSVTMTLGRWGDGEAHLRLGLKSRDGRERAVFLHEGHLMTMSARAIGRWLEEAAASGVASAQ